MKPNLLAVLFLLVVALLLMVPTRAKAPPGNLEPVFVEFYGVRQAGTIWVFYCSVIDDQPVDGLVVSFGGIPSLVGKYAVVNSQGYCQITVTLAVGEDGTASADTMDALGAEAETALFLVRY